MQNETQHTPEGALDCWAVIELFGHQKIAGRVKMVEQLGAPFLRVDVPKMDAAMEEMQAFAFTRFFNPKAIYAINPCDEEAARHAARYYRSEPVTEIVAASISDQMRKAKQTPLIIFSESDEGQEDPGLF
jgi:hypothetical protein